ncbi:hypothetical protein J6590_028336 [Homalodisca vitripennis]|nr:hypothetical protein J6590_028336 [Homalodisca vitripennis]
MILSHQLPVNFAATTAFHLLHKHARPTLYYLTSYRSTSQLQLHSIFYTNMHVYVTPSLSANMILSHQLPVNFAATTAFHLLHKHTHVCDTFTVSQHDTISHGYQEKNG